MVKNKKTEKELREQRRVKGSQYYHKHKDEINRKRRNGKTKKRSTSRRKKRSILPRRNPSLKISASGRIKIHCPIHKNQIVHRLVYNTAVRKNPSGKNKRGLVGVRGLTDWFYCDKCGKPYKAELEMILIA
jgi:hypothetical protein